MANSCVERLVSYSIAGFVGVVIFGLCSLWFNIGWCLLFGSIATVAFGELFHVILNK